MCSCPMPPEATILHADLDSFFASVEQRDDPRLLGRPVIVGGGVVLAASYEAKAFGVKTAMGGRRARRLCPHAIVVPPRFEAYSAASKAVFAVFDDTAPVVEGLSIDEAFLDVRGMQRIAGAPVEIAARLRERVRDRGRAADHRRRRAHEVPGQGRLGRGQAGRAAARGAADGELEFLHPLPVEKLWGVGVKTADKLHARGIKTVGRSRRSREPRWSGCSGARPGASCTRSRTAAIRGGSRSACGGDRSAASGRSGGAGSRRRRSSSTPAGRPDRPDHAPPAGGAARRADRDPAPALRRLLARDPLAHDRGGDGGVAGAAGRGARADGGARADDPARAASRWSACR